MIDRSFILSYPEVKMEIKEFAYRADQDIINSVIKAAKHPTMGRRIREERRSFGQWILRSLRCLSPKRWF
jgi:hypothetical protein